MRADVALMSPGRENVAVVEAPWAFLMASLKTDKDGREVRASNSLRH